MSMEEYQFWNNPDITDYFKSKPADPRIEAFISDIDTTNLRALDLGCGGGRHSEMLGHAGCNVSSIDVNPAMLRETQSRLSSQSLDNDVRFGSILDIPYDNETFDLVVTTGVLHQAKTVEEYMQAMQELARVVKPQGVVLLNIFTNGVWDDTYDIYSEDGYSVMTAEGLPMTLLPKELFVDMMQHHGFTMIDNQGEDIKQENTGPRAVFRAFFQKQS